MSPHRSIRVHPDKLPEVRQALERNGFLRQSDFAAHIDLALSTVSKFFNGHPVYITNFNLICDGLSLDRNSLADLPQQDDNDPEQEEANSDRAERDKGENRANHSVNNNVVNNGQINNFMGQISGNAQVQINNGGSGN